MTTDKLLTSFLGAVAALLLKYVYDSVVEYNRLADIRKMVYLDLKNQLHYVDYLIDECLGILKFINDMTPGTDLTFSEWNVINSIIFKAHPAKDYFKAFDEELYQDMMLIYQQIEEYSKRIEIAKLYDNFITSVENETDEIIIKEMTYDFHQRIENLMWRYKDIHEGIEKFVKDYEKRHHYSY